LTLQILEKPYRRCRRQGGIPKKYLIKKGAKKTMNEEQKNAWNLYMEGLTYKEINNITKVSIHTLKSWQKKFKWNRKTIDTSQGKNTLCRVEDTSKLTEKFKDVRGGLLEQLKKNGTETPYYIDLVNDYMKFWNIKNELIADVAARGVQVAYKNGSNQYGTKKNDSLDSAIKYSAQMLSILDKLNLNNPMSDDDDVEL
ncbi:MAG: P27 family phage terminase small subunit, partial [Paraclostridium sp.]